MHETLPVIFRRPIFAHQTEIPLCGVHVNYEEFLFLPAKSSPTEWLYSCVCKVRARAHLWLKCAQARTYTHNFSLKDFISFRR